MLRLVEPLFSLNNLWRTLTRVAFIIATLHVCSSSLGQIASPLYSIEPTQLKVINVDGSEIKLLTVVVSTQEDQRQGLMHVRHLPVNQSMLFLNQPPRPMSMWMKNTHISLDMWFVLPDLTIGHIVPHTVPFSLESVGFEKPVLAVVEVNAGLTKLLGISLGAKLEFEH